MARIRSQSQGAMQLTATQTLALIALIYFVVKNSSPNRATFNVTFNDETQP